MNKSNKRNADLLGMSWGAAGNKLRKIILFSLVCRLNLNICYRCGKEIVSVDDLSIEHKRPWRQADDPVQSYFDLDNIAFSHLSCNVAAGARQPTKYFTNKAQRLGHNERNRIYWHSLGKEEQRKRRREQWLRTRH